MPELPEVETIRQRLRRDANDQPSLLGLTIRRGCVYWERTLAQPTPAEFFERIAGQTVIDIERRGKYLIFRLDRDALLVHLRMSGDLLLESEAKAPGAYDRFDLLFNNGSRLAFADPRKFGRAWLVEHPQDILANLGPEPLENDFTEGEFYRRLTVRKRLLKPLLLDQTFIAGLGNIYTDEALYRARLHPLMHADQVGEEAGSRLWQSIRYVLEEGIRRNGASIDWVYRGGDFQNYFHVYRRTGAPCENCGTPIERLVVGQRSTHVCPTCQRM